MNELGNTTKNQLFFHCFSDERIVSKKKKNV